LTGLRVAIVTRRFWPLTGSTETVLAHLAAELTARGCPTTILTARWRPHWPAQSCCRNVPVSWIAPPPAGYWNQRRYLRALARWLEDYGRLLDVVYVSSLGDEARVAVRTVAPQTAVVLRPRRAGRSGDCFRQIENAAGRRIKDACLRASAFLAATPLLKRELEAAGYPRDRIHEVADGLPAAPPRTPALKQAARAMLADTSVLLQVPSGAPLAVAAGRLEPGHGLEQLVEAWKEVVQLWPGACLWLVGEAANCHALQQRIDQLRLTARVVLVGQFDALEGVLAAADMWLAPSSEGDSTAVAEAMAAGLPVLAADVAAHRWLLRDGLEGLLVPCDDTAAWVAAILRVLHQSDWSARLGAAARARAATQFSLARMVDEHLTLFQRVIQGEREDLY
jgi:glycosyltransferase involved in cell wall biosynthesis